MNSKISSIHVQNFMSLADATVTFDLDSPGSNGFHSEGIINIKGFNDSGKSALLIAVGVCLLDAYSSKQKTFIRDSQTHFHIVVSFDDGVRIVREKHSDGRSLYEMFLHDELIYSTRKGTTLTQVTGVPVPIQDYLNLHSEGKFLLNMRRRTDPMLLVSTKGSENFSMLNSVLKTSELSNAASAASAKANELNREILELENDIRNRKFALSEIWETPKTVAHLTTLVARETSLNTLQELFLTTEGILGNIPTVLPTELDDFLLSATSPNPLVGTVADLTSLATLLEQLKGILILPVDISPIDTSILSAFDDTIATISALPDYLDLTSLTAIDTSILSQIDAVLSSLSQLDSLSKELTSFHEELSTLTDSLHEEGYDLQECPSCKFLFPVSA